MCFMTCLIFSEVRWPVTSDMHLEKCPTANYREFFVNQTHFINFFNFPQNLIDVIRLRYKIMFLKDYIFCDHQKEEFLNYLNSVA